MARLEIDAVHHAFGGVPVLSGLSVTCTEHRVGVIGANGSGKSTFARLLNGLVLPDSGTVRVDGHDTRRDGRAVRRLVGFCFTDPDAQIVMPTVAEDVAFGLRPFRLARADAAARVAEALTQFGLEGLADRPTHALSGGEKQLLALAAVLVCRPRVLVLDEPTTLLDLRNASRVAELVAALSQQVVLVTHHLDLLDGFDRVLVFDRGRLVADGTPTEAVGHYRQLVR